jgi:large subunit ribosomal protein L16
MSLLAPKRTKYRKQQKGRHIKGKASRGHTVAFGDYGIQALEPVWLTAQQIEAARMVLARATPKGKVWVRVFPDKPYTRKPAESRMGKGKGDVVGWVAVVRPGQILFEFTGVGAEEAKEIHRKISAKLPIATKLARRVQLGVAA